MSPMEADIPFTVGIGIADETLEAWPEAEVRISVGSPRQAAMEAIHENVKAEAESLADAAPVVQEVDEITERAATKMQAAFRGARVRQREPLKHLRKIAGVRQKLTELKAKAADPAYVERICRDVMECRKLTEGIMALLFQLDVLQNVHPTVRDIRKSVNREVVEFMERVDAVVLGADSSPWQDSRNVPHIVRSSSISHIDRSSSRYPLRRTFSLDNQVCPAYPLPRKMMTMQAEQVVRGSGEDTCIVEMAEDATSFSANNLEKTGNDGEIVVLAALLIQSSFRGYRVRRSHPLKHLHNIADVRKNLGKLSIQVSSPGFPAKLHFDRKEHLQITERITALLLQLDSVQGVDGVVRDVRKSVTREVCRLQEVVDALIYEAENRRRQCGFKDAGGDISVATPRSDKENIPVLGERESLSNEHFGGFQARDVSVTQDLSEQALDLDHQKMRRFDYGTEKVGLATCGPDHQIKFAVIDPNTEVSRVSDDGQVRVLDKNPQNSPRSCSSAESEVEDQLHDHHSGPCAVFISGSNYSSRVHDEQTGTITTLNLGSAVLDANSAQGEHFEETTAIEVGNKAWQDCVEDMVDLHNDFPDSASAPVTSKEYCSPDFTLATNQFDLENLTAQSSLDNNLRQECGNGQLLERLDGSTGDCVEQDDLHSDDWSLADTVGLQKYIALKTPTGISRHAKNSEHLLECVEHAENLKPSKQYFGKIPCLSSKVIEEICSGKDRKPVAEIDYFNLISNYLLQPGIKFSLPAENEDCSTEGGKGFPILLKQEEGICHADTLPSGLSSVIYRSSGLADSSWSSSATNENSRDQYPSSMGLISPLVQENIKLRTLLNEVLSYSEFQSCRISAWKERVKQLEDEVTQCKRQESIWRRKTKNARRR